MALPYELKKVDELISETIHPKKLFNENSVTTSKQFGDWERSARSELTKAKKRIKPTAYSFLKEKHKRLYIRHHQSAIIHLLDLLFHYLYPVEYHELPEKPSDGRTERLYKRLFKECFDLLTYLRDTFPTSWKQDHKVPDSEIMRVQYEWKLRLPAIKRKMLIGNSDRKLVKLVLELLNAYSDKTLDVSLTYYEVTYMNELFQSLENLKKVVAANNFCPPINTLIIYLNLNKTSFKDYFSDCICTDVNKATAVKEKLDKLFFYYKQINQMHTKPGAALLPGAKSVKDEIREWLAGEIKYLQKTQNLGLIVPARFRNDTEYKKGLWVNYTIEEIGLLHRLQYEARFITNKKVKPMIEDLSKFVHTSSVHNISAKNLYNSFYNIDPATIQSVSDKLFALINHLRKIEGQLKRKAKEKQSLRK